MLERLEGARVVVTGAAGFLASHLCERLLGLGAERVIGIDNLLTGDLRNLDDLVGRQGFRFIKYDVTDYLHVPGSITHVLHFASPASPIDYLDLPIQTLKVGALGTHKALGLAHEKRATFMLASTSEVYGDPQVHPQPETYWGHVNPVGPRGVYDEAKRYAEALTYAYHRTHGVDVRVPRIFNSVLAGERLIVDDGQQLHVLRADELARKLGQPRSGSGWSVPLEHAVVPTVSDERTAHSAQAPWFVGHPTGGPCFEVVTRYGRPLRVTGDHSVFVRDSVGQMVATPVRQLTTDDHVAVARKVEVPTRERQTWDLLAHVRDTVGPWNVRVESPVLEGELQARRSDVVAVLAERHAGSSRQSAWSSANRMARSGRCPLGLLDELDIEAPQDCLIGPWTSGRSQSIPRIVGVTDELLWLLGLVVAEGQVADAPPRTSALVVDCEPDVLDRAEKILARDLDLHVSRSRTAGDRPSSLRMHSRALLWLLSSMGMHQPDKRIPGWVLGLPLRRLGYFLEGYREGDGVQPGKTFVAQVRHEFSTVSEGLRDDLLVALGRFGIVASAGQYETTFRQRTGDRPHPCFRITIPHVDPWSPLEWHRGIEQKLQSRVDGDIVWAKVRSVTQVSPTPLVYDFCVPGPERFVTATGIVAHNTFGPRLRPDDGRAVPTFIGQALRGDKITLHGDGSQTRSLVYVDDEVEGLLRLLASDWTEPCNLGNPHEVSIRELAELIRELCESDSEIVETPRPQDDPTVRQPDITVARRELGWEPTIVLRDGLARTIDWFRTALDGR